MTVDFDSLLPHAASIRAPREVHAAVVADRLDSWPETMDDALSRDPYFQEAVCGLLVSGCSVEELLARFGPSGLSRRLLLRTVAFYTADRLYSISNALKG